MTQDVTYSSYLDLDRILAAQHSASDAHDEMLLIIVHQASELWLKLCLHELDEARAHIAADDLRPAFKMLARVARAQGQLKQRSVEQTSELQSLMRTAYAVFCVKKKTPYKYNT